MVIALLETTAVNLLEILFLQYIKYTEYPMGGYSANSCFSILVCITDFCQYRFSIGGITVVGPALEVWVLYRALPTFLSLCSCSGRAASHYISSALLCALNLGFTHMLWDIHLPMDAWAPLSTHVGGCSKFFPVNSCIQAGFHPWPRWSSILSASCFWRLFDVCLHSALNRTPCIRQLTLMQVSFCILWHLKLIGGSFKTFWTYAWRFMQIPVHRHCILLHLDVGVMGEKNCMSFHPWALLKMLSFHSVFACILLTVRSNRR